MESLSGMQYFEVTIIIYGGGGEEDGTDGIQLL